MDTVILGYILPIQLLWIYFDLRTLNYLLNRVIAFAVSSTWNTCLQIPGDFSSFISFRSLLKCRLFSEVSMWTIFKIVPALQHGLCLFHLVRTHCCLICYHLSLLVLLLTFPMIVIGEIGPVFTAPPPHYSILRADYLAWHVVGFQQILVECMSEDTPAVGILGCSVFS